MSSNPPHIPALSWSPLMSLLAALSFSCSGEDGGQGSLSVLLESEDLIVSGLQPGEGQENIRDGWAVDFDRYLVSIGDVGAQLGSDASLGAADPRVFVVDLTAVPSDGLPLWQLDGLAEGRWDFNYATPAAEASSQRHRSADEADYDAMVADGWTYLIAGTLSQSGGLSCPPSALASPPQDAEQLGENAGGDPCYANPEVRFQIGAPAATDFGPCEIDGLPGFAITAGRQQTVGATIHGDHIFFNGFPESSEGGVMRLAQWLADCDLDLDGEVTVDELGRVDPSSLPEIDERYSLGGSPITPLDSMYTYWRAQLKTQGHFQGEGECPIDGR